MFRITLKVATLLFVLLLLYDVFWVFFSSQVFQSNVMVVSFCPYVRLFLCVEGRVIHLTSYLLLLSLSHMQAVAVKAAKNPVGIVAEKLSIAHTWVFPTLSLPAKLVIPSSLHAGDFSMLGLGVIVIPGLLVGKLERERERERVCVCV